MLIGDYRAAGRYISEARSSFEDAEDEVGQGAALELLGDLSVQQNELDPSVRAYKEARRIEQIHSNRVGCRIYRKLGDVYFRRHEYQRAEEAFEQADDYLRNANDPEEKGALYLARGKLAVSLDDNQLGIHYYERALESYGELQTTDRTSEVYRLLSASHQALGQFDEAMSYMRSMGLEQAALWASLLKSLHPEIAEVVTTKYLSGEYGDTVLAAFSKLEQAVIERTTECDERSVSGRIRAWVVPEKRGLAPFGDEERLRAFQNFCVSSFSIFRNAAAHNWRDFDGVDSFAAIAVAHMIATYLDEPTSDRPLVGDEQSSQPAEDSGDEPFLWQIGESGP